MQCKFCSKEFDSQWGLSSHTRQKHKLSSEEAYILYQLNETTPTCKCGCGQKPKFLGSNIGFRDYKRGHAARVHTNFSQSEETIKKRVAAFKKSYKEGNFKVWNKGLTMDDERVRKNIEAVMNNPERGKKISKALTGRQFSEKHKKELSKSQKKSWTKERKDAKRKERVAYFRNKQLKTKSNLEQFFEDEILKSLQINFINQYELKGFLYDFYIPDKNILIEVDGDWFHVNKTIYNEAKYPIQKATIKNDVIKNMVARKEGYSLLRFWESDILNEPEKVKEKLSGYLLP